MTMKLEIDLDDIFRDENGAEESLEESVRRQVIDRLSGDLRKRLFDRIDARLSQIMNEQIGKVMEEKMPTLIDDIMNVEYRPVSRYGECSEPTTFRTEIIRAVSGQMVYAPKRYESEENTFTKAVRSIVNTQTRAIQDAISQQVDAQFKESAIKFAVEELSRKLGLTK